MLGCASTSTHCLWLLSNVLLKSLDNNTSPPFREFRLEGLASSVENANVDLREIKFQWFTNKPQTYELSLADIKLPKKSIESLLTSSPFAGRSLPLPEILKMDATIRANEESGGTIIQQGDIAMHELCDLRYSFKILKAASDTALLNRAYSDLSIVFDDKGILARAGIFLSPDGHGQSMMESFLDSLENDASPADVKIISSLKDFIRQPGRIEIKSHAGQELSWATISAGNFNLEDLLSINITPGNESFASQTARLMGQ